MLIGVCTGVVASGFVALRFAVAARDNLGSFILVGAHSAQRLRVPRGIPIFSSGYDGQFYYRLALDPLAWGRWAFGIKLDNVFRIERIGYPVLAWLAAAGHGSLVPETLVFVNVASLAVLAGLGAALARDAGRAPLSGVVFAGYWGLLWSLSRDLTEIVTALGIVAGLLALRRGRPILAGGALCLAVVSRESALVVVGALCLSRVIGWTRALRGKSPPRRALTDGSGHHGPSRLDLAWVIPVAVFCAWQCAVWARTGSVPFSASRGANVGVPFVGLARGVLHYVPRLPSTASLLWVGELALLVVVGLGAAMSYRGTTALLHERLAWVGYVILAVSLAPGTWLGDVGFRSLDECFLFSWVLLLCSRRRLQVPTVLVATAWLVVAVQLVLYI